MPSAINNPAGRLHIILTRLVSVTSGKPLIDAWAQALEVSSDDHAAIWRGLALVVDLPRQIRELVNSDDSLQEGPLLEYMDELEEALSSGNFYEDVQAIKRDLHPALMYSLATCSWALGSRVPEKALSEERLAEIREQIDELLKDVLASAEIDEELRAYLTRHLHEMLAAVDDFVVRGPSGLEDFVHRSIGVLARRPETWHESHRHPLGMRFWALLGTVGFLMGFVNDAVQLPESVRKAIPATSTPTVPEPATPPTGTTAPSVP